MNDRQRELINLRGAARRFKNDTHEYCRATIARLRAEKAKAIALMVGFVKLYGGYPGECNDVHIGHELCTFLANQEKGDN